MNVSFKRSLAILYRTRIDHKTYFIFVVAKVLFIYTSINQSKKGEKEMNKHFYQLLYFDKFNDLWKLYAYFYTTEELVDREAKRVQDTLHCEVKYQTLQVHGL